MRSRKSKITSKIIKLSEAGIVSLTLKMAKKEIIQELIELDSSLVNMPAVSIYAVPEAYFDRFSLEVMTRIKALNAATAKDELNHLSPLLNTVSRTLPYTVDSNYFQDLPELILQNVRNHEDYQTAEEELISLSPLLSNIGNKNPYAVPGDYFENFGKDINLKSDNKPAGKIIPLVKSTWFRFAAAAVAIGFIALTGISLFFNNATVTTSNTHEWVEKNTNNVSTDELNNFIQSADEDPKNASVATVKSTELMDLMKDVSDNDIQDFLNKTNVGNDENDADILLN
jgi:hypothetical protein